MTERIYSDVTDRTGWGEGPWDGEPDKVQWIDPATGLDCLAVRGPMGCWCGYVGVPPGHPWHGLDYDDLDCEPEVHGGLTFADRCMEDLPEDRGVCHIPEEGRPADIWWLGFDCGHFLDVSPGLEARLREAVPGRPSVFDEMNAPEHFRPVYRDLDYVRAETTQLARQAFIRGGSVDQGGPDA